MSKTLLALLGVLAVGTAVGLAARDNDKEDKENDDARVVARDKVPVAVRKALTKLAGSAKIEAVEMEHEGDVKLYEASWQIGGVEHEVTVTAGGDVVETEQAVELGATPKAVQNAAKKAFPKGTKVNVEKKAIVLYELEADIDGKEVEILVAPTGQRVEVEHEDRDDEDHEHEGDDENDG